MDNLEEYSEEVSLDNMSVSSLIEYCHTAANQINVDLDELLLNLNGKEPTPFKKEKIDSNIFTNCVDLADMLIKLKEKVKEISDCLVS